MSVTSLILETRRGTFVSRLADYLELTKPRIGVMVLVTVGVAGFVGAGGAPQPLLMAQTLLAVAFIAASASALNQWLERDSDALMARTADRPLPAGRLGSWEVFWFGLTTALIGVLYLLWIAGGLAASLGLVTWGVYVWLYTPLKSRTPANTLVGAVAGALPVLIGWAALAGPSGPVEGAVKAGTLFLIVFLWQFPHFMAIAWIYRAQYAAAGQKMAPVVDPSGGAAASQAVAAAAVLAGASLFPWLETGAAWGYLLASLALGLVYLASSVHFARQRSDAAARSLLRVSLVYLPALLAVFVWSARG